jgi:holo-[acyl-carrier protein] synthase
MILGLGIDIIEVERIREVWKRHGERFARRILRDSELAYCLAHSDPAPCLAVRFAAKEAVSKAFGTGIGAELNWQDIEVERLPSGQPVIRLHDAGARLMESRGATRVHLSLTHSTGHAAAVAILEN